MAQTLLFLGFSLLVIIGLISASWYKKVDFRTLTGLFLFGMFISLPFVLVEYLSEHMKFYIAILTFIAIELLVLYCESRIKYFHDLVHHNVKDLRILSFFLIGAGFTCSEIAFTIFHSDASIAEMVNILPLKTVYALLMHTVLTSAATLMNFGNLLAETIYETVLKLFSYYSRITVISVSHYLYSFTLEHNAIYLMSGILLMGMIAFFQLKKHLDFKLTEKAG